MCTCVRLPQSRHNLKHHWHKAFDPQSNAFYYWDSVTGEVWMVLLRALDLAAARC